MKVKARNKRDSIEKIQKTTDIIVFMSAYDVHKFNKRIPKLWHKPKTKELLKQFHIIGLSTQNSILTKSRKTEYTTEYNSLKHISEYKFQISEKEYTDEVKHELEQTMGSLVFHHSAKTLLDTNKTQIKHCFNLESFLVYINSEILQVDPFAYFLNGVLIINFELVHFETGEPLSFDEIYGRTNNYGILPIQAIKYFDEDVFSADNRKISEIIFDNIWGLLDNINRHKYTVRQLSFVHNILVFSNNINEPKDYFKKVLGAPSIELDIKDLGTSKDFKYYSKEYLALVTSYSENNISNILVDIQVLESLKTFILLQMIIDVEINDKLNTIVDHQIYLRSLYYQSHAPVITLNVIDNLKTMVSYIQYKSAIDFKVEALKVLQDRQKTKNGRLLNVLLYILALIGSFQTLEVLKTEFRISFGWGVAIVCIIFGVFGLIWLCREIKD